MIALLFLVFAATTTHAEYVRVCYYSNWARYRPSPATYTPDDIDPFLCTHIVYAFAKIDSYDKLVSYDKWSDISLEGYAKVVALKNQNPNLKVLLAVGGWNHELYSSPFSRMVGEEWRMNNFIQSTLSLLAQYNFDGLDLDWEYPGSINRHSPAQDKFRFTTLCRKLKEAFASRGYLLTVAVSANYKAVPNYYETNQLGQYLDMLHLMTYDLWAYWDGVTGHQTALYSLEYTIINGVEAWTNNGFPAEKIALGLANYGQSYTLSNPANADTMGSPASRGVAGPYLNQAGYLAYFEICQMGLEEIWSDEVGAPYGVKGSTWVAYDTPESMRKKVDEVIIAMGLKGAMFWAIDMDDFSGSFCGQGRYPLMNAVKDALENAGAGPVTTTKAPVVTTTQEPVVTTTQEPVTNPPAGQCFGTGPFYGVATHDAYCELACQESSGCEWLHCTCDPNYQLPTTCTSSSGRAQDTEMCNRYCPDTTYYCISVCDCSGTPQTTTTEKTVEPVTTTSKSTTEQPATTTTTTTIETTTTEQSGGGEYLMENCRGIGPWMDNVNYVSWCFNNCQRDLACPTKDSWCTCDPGYQDPTPCVSNLHPTYDYYCTKNCPSEYSHLTWYNPGHCGHYQCQC